MSRSNTTPSRSSRRAATTAVAAAAGSIRRMRAEAGVGGVVVEHDPGSAPPPAPAASSPSRPGLAASKLIARSGSSGAAAGCTSSSSPGRNRNALGQVERLREGGRHVGEAQLAQPEPEAEHAAQRVTVRVDVTHQQHRRVAVERRDGLRRPGQLRRRVWTPGRRDRGHRRSLMRVRSSVGRSSASSRHRRLDHAVRLSVAGVARARRPARAPSRRTRGRPRAGRRCA